MMNSSPVVIVGAGYAGVHAASRLAQEGEEGNVVLVDQNDCEPFERPPLSKHYLTDGTGASVPPLRRPGFYADRGITLRRGDKVVAIDRAAKKVHFSSGNALDYRCLILATGSRARTLPVPGCDLPGVVVLKTPADAIGIRSQLTAGRKIVIVGAGYIGMEVASAAVHAGCKTTVIEALDRAMQRVTSPVVSTYFENLHREHGVDFAFNTGVIDIAESSGGQMTVRCADGTLHIADLVVAGIGVCPNQELAHEAGLDCADGVLVDKYCRTSDPTIYAVGDVTRFTCTREGADLRLECVQNAITQADTAVDALLGLEYSTPQLPWFWTVQHGVRLQSAGIRNVSDEVVVRGDPATGHFSVLYVREGRLAALDTIGALKDFTKGKKLILSRSLIDISKAGDEEIRLTDAVATAA